MKSLIFTLSITIILALSACNRPTTYTVTKLIVKPDSLYNEEAKKFLGKSITIEQFDNAIKLHIEGHNPLFLSGGSQNGYYNVKHDPLEYSISYGLKDNGVSYSAIFKKEQDGSDYLSIQIIEPNKHPTDTVHYHISGDGVGAALSSEFQNKVRVDMIAKP